MSREENKDLNTEYSTASAAWQMCYVSNAFRLKQIAAQSRQLDVSVVLWFMALWSLTVNV